MELIQAIAKMEGFGVRGSRANRNNNPGNIEYGLFAHKMGALRVEDAPAHGTPRFAYFPTVDIGFDALKQLLKDHYFGMTVAQAISKYAPANENDTKEYISNICHWVGCNETDIIDTLL